MEMTREAVQFCMGENAPAVSSLGRLGQPGVGTSCLG